MNTLRIQMDQESGTVKLSREIFTEETVTKYQGKKAIELFPDGNIAGMPLKDILDDFQSYKLDFVPGNQLKDSDDMEEF